MHILQVSTTDTRGGAEKIAWNLFTKYHELGHDSWLAVGEKHSSDPDVLVLPNQDSRGKWYHYFRRLASKYQKCEVEVRRETIISRLVGGMAEPVRRLEYHLGLEDFNYPGTALLLNLKEQKPDILHAHNLHGAYFDLRMLPSTSHQVPILMTLHDAWLLSGHCAHSFDCEKWKTGCGKCPDLAIYPAVQRDATHFNWLRKKAIYQHSQFYIATPSKWLISKVEQSMLSPAIIEARVIPNGVDLSIFHPADRKNAREKLNIRSDIKVLLVMGVQIHDNTWKDYQTLRQTLSYLAEQLIGQDIIVLALGEEAPKERIGQVEIQFIPYQEDSRAVAQYYQAADIYVHAAHVDTFPTSILEALACGIPVVATTVGGIPEQVEDSQTGFLTLPGDARNMADRILQLLEDTELHCSMGGSAAECAKQKYSLNRQADAYLNWYEEIKKYSEHKKKYK